MKMMLRLAAAVSVAALLGAAVQAQQNSSNGSDSDRSNNSRSSASSRDDSNQNQRDRDSQKRNASNRDNDDSNDDDSANNDSSSKDRSNQDRRNQDQQRNDQQRNQNQNGQQSNQNQYGQNQQNNNQGGQNGQWQQQPWQQQSWQQGTQGQQAWNQNQQHPQGWQQNQQGWNQNQQNGQQNQPYNQHQQWQQANAGQGWGYGGNTTYAAGSQDSRFQQYGQQSNNQQGNFNQAPTWQQGSDAWSQQQNQGPSLGILLTAHPTHGVVVAQVNEHAAGGMAGLRQGDQIVAVNGQHIYSNQDLIHLIHSTNPQQGPLNLTVVRNGQQMNLQAMLTPNHDQGWMSHNGQPMGQGFARERPALGVTLHQNGPNDVRISNVFPNSPAQRAGLQPGDRIVSIGEQHVGQTDDVIHLVSNTHPDQRLPVQVERNGQIGTVWTMPDEGGQMQNQR